MGGLYGAAAGRCASGGMQNGYGVRPRDWGKVLGSYVYENLAGAELTMYDEYGNPETVYLARENDRVKKDGANRPHKVLDKLARY